MDPYKKLSSLQEISKAQLSKIFSISTNKKFLVIETALIKPLERVCGLQWLKSSGVDRIFKLEPLAPNFEEKAVFYMISSNLQSFTYVLEQIRAQVDILNNPPANKFHIIVIPRYIHLFEEELEQYGLLESAVKLHSFQWMPLHLDTGILSLEMPLLYKTVFVEESYNLFPELPKVLWQLMHVIGTPNVTISLGQHSNNILKLLDDMWDSKGNTDVINSDFGALVIIDRNIDYPSALLTPGIYSGLLSEIYSVRSGICDAKNLKEAETGTEQILDEKYIPIKKKQPVNITLNSQQDPVYGDIKNRYFTQVTAVLSSLTKQLKSEQLSSQEMALDEIKRYVQTQLQATKSRKQFITNHLLAAESIINILGHKYERQKDVEINLMKNSNKNSNWSYLNEILLSENDMLSSLRLFCLISITQTLSEKEVNSFRRKFIHQFGFYGFAFKTLEKLGILNEPNLSLGSINISGKLNLKLPKFISSNFYVNAKNLRQIPTDPDNINLHHPTCASYVFGGAYIPLITQIAGLLLNSVPLEEIRLKLENVGPLILRNDKGYPLLCRNILIFMVGGVTYAEIAACNLLETLMGSKICILSDRVITGNDLMADILSV
ncbi:vacuolar protein sorting-associated protein 33B [Anthonomus grandis grandis]|uniref:vacuolar protein sorting-associated protein 33B n=1 Tax=Anthonomus grandis grandis TaxID=2921223 RepID=UPI002166A73A|nr:vacuolar protein sorting-associated protein 33B [Anthonomus grandis grandis]